METKRTNTEAAVEIQLDGRVNENAFVENANENQKTSKSGMVASEGRPPFTSVSGTISEIMAPSSLKSLIFFPFQFILKYFRQTFTDACAVHCPDPAKLAILPYRQTYLRDIFDQDKDVVGLNSTVAVSQYAHCRIGLARKFLMQENHCYLMLNGLFLY